MLLIATDEAGYGPKLGPLVVAATAWHVPDDLSPSEFSNAFAALRQPIACEESTVVVDDSKAVFQPSGGLGALHATVSAASHWARHSTRSFPDLLRKLCPDDLESIAQTPWLEPAPDIEMLAQSVVTPVLEQWGKCECELIDARARIIAAGKFNQICSRGSNKADLLSETTLQLVRQLWLDHHADETFVFCDRHGGRRYYAGVLQHVMPEAWVQVVSESAQQSVYQIQADTSTLTVHFTVKGDSFTPVALASIHAKYLRERMMESFNRYFASLSEMELKPTAGYPVDADRFLRDIKTLIDDHAIDPDELIRCR